MTSKIFSDLLDIINKQFRSQNQNVLLFLDNCTSHKNQEYSKIKLCFLPPNTTSLIQPMDQGIIRSFKAKYRKVILQFILIEADKGIIPVESTKKVNLLDAIY